ncbi:MAG: hypothetical protein C1O27_002211 [Chloroflexi bacterium]|jgi:hypothetical protein|nr:MAG: hypothetical protein C1O27_002211 [Chloroflexota bacterium]
MKTTVHYFEEVELGDEVPALERRATPEAVRLFVEIARRKNVKLFTESEAARKVGSSKPIVPGDLVMAYIAQALQKWAPEATIEVLDVIFRQPMSQMEPLHAGGLVTDLGDPSDGRVTCDVFVIGEQGDRLVLGTAQLTMPSKESAPNP